MPKAPIVHFALNADDPARAQRFYGEVFGWTFEPWGPPEFFHVGQDNQTVQGALQKRRALGGKNLNGLECTLAVEDVDAVAAAVVEHGGTIVMDKATIHGVGDLIFFEDPEGNILGAMQYHVEPWW